MTHNPNTAAHIQHIIKTQGPIPFGHFMHEALYAPEVGYYVAGKHKLGKQGDFVTAPELSPMFGSALAKDIDRFLEAHPHACILELGPGTGKLASSILRHLKHAEKLNHYLLLEVSPDLIHAQNTHLKDNVSDTLYKKVQHIQALPTNFTGIIIANEVADAMPVERFQIQANIQQQYVEYHNGSFRPFYTKSTDQHLIDQVERLNMTLPPGYVSEINLALGSWVRSLAECLEAGYITIIDYGYDQNTYYQIERHGGTLKCFFQHRAHDDPFIHVGLQDITAHVNFSTIARAAIQSGLDIVGYAEQGHFLMNLGIAEIAQSYYIQDPLKTAHALKLFTMPSQMGSVCKAIGLSKNIDNGIFSAFSRYNRSATLMHKG